MSCPRSGTEYLVGVEFVLAKSIESSHSVCRLSEKFLVGSCRIAFRKQAFSLYSRLFYSSFFNGFFMFWPLVSSGTVGTSKVVFSFIFLPVLVQSTFKCLDVW